MAWRNNDTVCAQVTTRAHLRLKLFKYAVTSKQDLRVRGYSTMYH